MTTTRTVRSALLCRVRRLDEDERGSMAFLMLVIIATIALGGVLMSMIISQSRTSKYDQTRQHSLAAAQAGIDWALGQLRDATTTDTDGNTVGDDTKLPCSGPYSGASDNAGVATYSVAIDYYYRQPLVQSNHMTCSSAGPYFRVNGTLHQTPHFAIITSTGSDGTQTGSSVGRKLQTSYVFNTNDANLIGGQIMIYPSGSARYCMDAGASPSSGTGITAQPCSSSSPPSPAQVWAYRQDLSIELLSTSDQPVPLCIDTGSNPTSHTGTETMVLEPCRVNDVTTYCGDGVSTTSYAASHNGAACNTSPMCPAGVTPATYRAPASTPLRTCSRSPWNQQWSVDDSAHLRGAQTDQTTTDGYCINLPSQSSGSALTLATCAGGVTDTAQTWVPSATTGAGMAGAGNNQLVNYQQFATCIDVTGTDVNTPFLILYTCKQNPNPAKVLWNQKFTPSPALPTTGEPKQVLLMTTNGSTTYCLKSPRQSGGYPVLGSCPTSVAAGTGSGYAWTVSQLYTDSTDTSLLPYSNRYTIKDDSSTPLCLSAGLNSDLFNNAYAKVVVADCDGGTEQKWNASASGLDSTLTDTHELPVTSGN